MRALILLAYANGEGYDELIGFFKFGNAWTFERLARRFEEGPLDWTGPGSGAGTEDQAKTQ